MAEGKPKKHQSNSPTLSLLISGKVQRLRFSVHSGPDRGVSAEITGRTLSIGSHATNDLVLSDPTVSGFHCVVASDEHGCRLIDRESRNGTYLNGMRVVEAWVGDAAQIRVGETTLVAQVAGDPSVIPLFPTESFSGVLGRSRCMREVFATADRAASSRLPVMLLGETGVGKDAFAEAIHARSDRANRPFVAFNCAAVTPTLAESELFGHAAGAFTGADKETLGFFGRANSGTLFINEVGELPPRLQSKLLHVLDNGCFTPVGGHTEISVDLRVISATNRDIRAMVEDGRFRADLYYRLAVVAIDIPPLRKRTEDIPLLVLHFLRELAAREHKELLHLLPHLEDQLAKLSHYKWPGNVRELRNAVERATALSDEDELSKGQLPHVLAFCANVTKMMASRPPLETARRQFDREYLHDVLALTQGDIRRAADIAAIHPNSLTRLLRRYGMR